MMPSAKANKSSRRSTPEFNNTTPSGVASLALSADPEDLLLALTHGNRVTRRAALRNLQKFSRKQRKEGAS